MAYLTVAELCQRVGERPLAELSSRQVTHAAAIDSVVVQTAIDDATSLINSYLRSRYTLPLASPDSSLKRCCADLAVYNLQQLHRLGDNEDSEKRYARWLKWLQAIASGAALLGTQTADANGAAQPEDLAQTAAIDTAQGFAGRTDWGAF